jgi:hypothetical protein
MYDFLSDATPDYNAELGISPQGVVLEESTKNQAIHLGADGSEERVSFNTSSIFHITIGWNQLSESDSGIIFDFYNDTAKANGIAKTFKYNYGDGHTYVVRFDCALPRQGTSKDRYGLPGVKFKVIGRIAD